MKIDLENTENNAPAENPNRRKFLARAGALLLAAQGLSASDAAAQNVSPLKPGPDNFKNLQPSGIDFLKKHSTSLLESAIYLLRGTHENITLTQPGLTMQTPARETLVGYAVTSLYSTGSDDARGRRENQDYWSYVFSRPGPKLAVSIDASPATGRGSSWGQQNAHIHRALGCRGVLTDGGVRDIPVFRELDLKVFSGSLTNAHGNPHFVGFGERVKLFGMTVNPGDIVCADEHGALVVPLELLPNIEQAVAENQRRVRIVADYCQNKNFNPQGLAGIIKNLKPPVPWKPQ